MAAPNPDLILARMRRDADSDWVELLIDRLDSTQHAPSAILTPRELDALRCAAVGLTGPMAADLLGIAYHTLKQHQKAAILRLKAKNVTHAVALAYRQGLIM